MRPNDGDLDFLNKQYRAEHDLNKPKKVGPAWGGRVAGGVPIGRRDWFSAKYYASIMKLNEHEADFYGDTYNGLMASALSIISMALGKISILFFIILSTSVCISNSLFHKSDNLLYHSTA